MACRVRASPALPIFRSWRTVAITASFAGGAITSISAPVVAIAPGGLNASLYGHARRRGGCCIRRGRQCYALAAIALWTILWTVPARAVPLIDLVLLTVLAAMRAPARPPWPAFVARVSMAGAARTPDFFKLFFNRCNCSNGQGLRGIDWNALDYGVYRRKTGSHGVCSRRCLHVWSRWRLNGACNSHLHSPAL